MTVDQVFIIKKLQNLDEMLVAYSAVTRMPFAICDDESFNDQVWIFTDQDKLKTFAEKYKEEKKLILPVKVQKKDAHSICMILCPVFQIRMRAESLFSELMKSRIIKK